MKNRTISIFLASGAIFGSLMVGCSGAAQQHPKLANSSSTDLAPRIERLLADHEVDVALGLAEQLVSAKPQDGAARAMLGRAYLAAGRYSSARTAFGDAMTLGNRDPRTIVSLALSHVALGNPAAAQTFLSDNIQNLPASDYGLAMAMAGDPQEGVRALLEAVRAPDANAKTRLNLAYALALGGAWGQARLVAGQDLTARDAEQRISQWTQQTGPGKEKDRVIAMIGVSPRADDAGLPTRLALNLLPSAADAAPVQLARAPSQAVPPATHNPEQRQAPISVPAPAPQRAAAVAAAPMPVVAQTAVAAPTSPTAPTAVSAPAQVQFAPTALAAILASKPVVQPVASKTVAMAQPVAARARGAQQVRAVPVSYDAKSLTIAQPANAGPMPRMDNAIAALNARMNRADGTTSNRRSWVMGISAPASDAVASDWVVQLGAFNSEAVAREKWTKIIRSRAVLKDFRAVHSVFDLNGRTYYRLAIRGFETRKIASAACTKLQSVGQACFVRMDDTQATRLARADALKQSNRLASAESSGRATRAR